MQLPPTTNPQSLLGQSVFLCQEMQHRLIVVIGPTDGQFKISCDKVETYCIGATFFLQKCTQRIVALGVLEAHKIQSTWEEALV
jgi:hypothetical protein